MSHVSEDTHEFRQGTFSSLFSTVRYLLTIPNSMDNKRLCKLVKDEIHRIKDLSRTNLSNNVDKDKKVIRKTCGQTNKIKTIDDGDKLEALVSLCRKIFAVVFITKHGQVTSSVNVRYYTRNCLSFEECVYMIYDETSKHYAPLYLSDKRDPGELLKIFDRKDIIIKLLLPKFFKEQLHYDKFVQLNDGTDTMASEILPPVQDVSDNIPDNIGLNTRKNTLEKQITAKADECVIISNPTMKKSDTSEDDHQSSAIKTIISHATHEFRIGELPGDDKCVFSSAIHLFDRSQTINVKSLREKVANYIRKSVDIDDISLLHNTHCQTREEYCFKVEEGVVWTGESERRALAHFYPNILFCIISKTNTNMSESPVHIDTYVKDISSYKKCIIIFYDMATNNYSPLFLYDKINHQEEDIRFKYDDVTKLLLEKFIRNMFNYLGYINFGTDVKSAGFDLHCHIEDDSVYVCEKIAANTTTNILTISNSEKHKKSDRISSSKTSSHALKATPKFFQEEIALDNHCLFSSICFALRNLDGITVKDLRRKVADFMLRSDTIDEEVLFSETGETLEQYCNKMGNTDAWGGEAEFRAIGKLYSMIVCIVNPHQVDSVISSVRVTELPNNEPSFEKCVYVIYERNIHYEPLYLCDENDPNKEITIFDRNDETVKKLLCEFIREKFNYNGSIQFGNETNGDGIGLECHVKNKSINESNLIDKDAEKTLTRKRKTRDDDENPSMADTTTKLTSSISNTNEVINIQSSITSRPIPPSDYIYTHHKVNELPSSIEQLLQTDIYRTLDPCIIQLIEQQQKEPPLRILSTKTTVSNNTQNEQMKFEIEPISRFRGRLLSDYMPKKGFRNDGTKSGLRKPNYFSDAQNRHYLNLLIPETFLVADLHHIVLEITIITRTINECIYVHPYFAFYDLRSDRKSPTVNPLFINLGYDELHKLAEYSEGIRNLLLYLPVIMFKNDELLQNQPIKLFWPSNSNKQGDIKQYSHCDTYKQDFHLNDLRFAVNLCVQVDNKLHRLIQYQYISGISTQDKNFKVEKLHIP